MKPIALHAIWLGEAKCRRCAVRASALFAGLEEADFSHIHQPIKDVVLSPQQALYRMHERGGALFTLRGGVMKLVQYLPDGSQRIVRLLKDSDALGLEALVGQPYQHDAIALTDWEICAIPSGVIERLEGKGINRHAFAAARKRAGMDENKRKGFDMSYEICCKALGVQTQTDWIEESETEA